MKKCLAFICAAGLAVSTTTASASGDDIPLPSGINWYQEFVKTMCALTGAAYYCDKVDPNYKSPTTGPGGQN